MLVAIMATGLVFARLGRQQGSPTPLELFQKMLPVVRHPRCINCHGGVDPGDATQHGGGVQVPDADCTACHDDAKAKSWSLPVRDHFFVGKTDQQLCSLFAEFAMKQGHARFISNHLKGDELIIAAFKGLMAGARNPTVDRSPAPRDPPADPPPISQQAFVQLGQDWVDQGQGACDVLGSITLQESVAAGDTFAIGPITTRNTYNGSRSLSINLRDGKYYADIKTDYTLVEIGEQHLVSPTTGRPCSIIHTRREHQTGTTTGVASVAIKDTIFFADTKPPQTDYRIDVMLPPERTQKTESRIVDDECRLGISFPAQNETESFTWGRAWFVIEGHIEDPQTDGRAGSCDRISKSSEINTTLLEFDRSMPCFRFKNMGNSLDLGLMDRTMPKTFHDQVAIPYHLVANWNLKYTK